MEHGARRDDDSQWRHSLSPPLPTMDRSPLPEDMQHRLCPSPSHDPLRIAESRSPLPYKEEVVMDAQRIFSPTITIDTHGRSPVHPWSVGERIRPTQARKLTLLRLGGSSSAEASRMGGSTEAVLVTRWFLCCCVSQKCIAWAFVLPEGSNHPKVVVDASADSMTPGVARAPSMSPLSMLPSSLKSDDVIMARLRGDDRQPVVARRLRSAGPTLHTFCLAPKCRHKESGASTSRRWPRRAPDELYSTTSPIVHLDDPRRSHETHDA